MIVEELETCAGREHMQVMDQSRAAAQLVASIAALYRRDAAEQGLACLARAADHLDRLSPLNVSLPPATTLPVRRYLDRALLLARSGALAGVSDGIAEVAPLCCWRQNQNYVRDPAMANFLPHYGYAEFVGKDAFYASNALLCGVMLLGPGTTYPRHSHPAEEVYHVLSANAEWQRGDAPWRTVAQAAAIHHPPDLAHATRTGDEPLLALYCWLGDVGVAATLSA